jgi:diguanylate cyclase (GGDEF)-like protein/PAS domain S-box-containing protein
MTPEAGLLLIVDDAEANRDMLCRRLQRKGYTTTAAVGGKEALELVGQQRFDLVLLDITMPDLDGMAVLKILRQTYTAAELPVIMVTAKQQSEDMVAALELGANDYVTKPIDFPVALARISTQLARKRAEEALRESEERYALAVRGANDGLWDWHFLTNEIYFSPRWKAMLGHTEAEVPNKPDAWFSLVHPEDRAPLQGAITAHCQGQTPHFEHEHRMLHKDGSYRWMLSRGLAVRDRTGQAYRMAGSLTDVTERKVVDGLTGLPNRLLFMDRLGQAIAHTARRRNYYFAVLFLDLDRFKVVTESLGPTGGDHLLIAIAQRLEHHVRAGDSLMCLPTEHTIARLGGDQFAILLDDLSDVSDASRVAGRLQRELAAPFTLDEQDVFVTTSIGIALSTVGYARPEDFLRDAEIAMHRAKARGRGCCEVYDRGMHTRAVTRLQVEMELWWAVSRLDFCAHYQPIIALATGRIAGFEALIRWPHPERGLVSPGEFIPVAEETGLILPIGAWILQEACRQSRVWQEQFPTTPPLFISINLSGKQFAQPDLVAQIAQVLQETGLPPRSVKLEITESVLMDNAASIDTVLAQLRALGMQLSLDDFGTGYSSLSYLRRFPLDTLKIDRSFISAIGAGAEDTAIVQTIVTLAHQLGMDVVAEGIESAQHLLHLRALGCEYGQGYFVSRPIDAETAGALLAAEPQW